MIIANIIHAAKSANNSDIQRVKVLQAGSVIAKAGSQAPANFFTAEYVEGGTEYFE
jgi:hypothetical protein